MNNEARWIVVAGLSICVIGLLVYRLTHSNPIDARQSQINQMADWFAKGNVWKRSDYIEFRAIEQRFYDRHTGIISPTDFDWLMLHLTMSKSPKDSPQAVDARILGLLRDATLTRDQVPRVSDALLTLLSKDDESYDSGGLTKFYACAVERQVRDRRAIPILLTLYNDPRPSLHYNAGRALNTMGYALPIGNRPS